MNPDIYIECKSFAELSVEQLYNIAKLRQDVFIIEQQSIYMDLDELDQNSWHFLGVSTSKGDSSLMAYARLRYISEKAYYKIERVVCAKNIRAQGFGNLLMEHVLKKSLLLSTNPHLKLSSQLSAVTFYEKFGFTKSGTTYDDGGIDHVDMLLIL